jgi:hypothetical protein
MVFAISFASEVLQVFMDIGMLKMFLKNLLKVVEKSEK